MILGIAAETVATVEGALANELALRSDGGAYFLDLSKLRIHIDLEAPWYQCRECTQLMPSADPKPLHIVRIGIARHAHAVR